MGRLPIKGQAGLVACPETVPGPGPHRTELTDLQRSKGVALVDILQALHP